MSTMREREFLAAMKRPAPVAMDTWRVLKRWTPEEIEHVIAMYGVKTAGQLGREDGVSRNAITGVWIAPRSAASSSGGCRMASARLSRASATSLNAVGSGRPQPGEVLRKAEADELLARSSPRPRLHHEGVCALPRKPVWLAEGVEVALVQRDPVCRPPDRRRRARNEPLVPATPG